MTLQEPARQVGTGLLLVVAAPAEARVVGQSFGHGPQTQWPHWQRLSLSPGVEMVLTGVGKAAAAGGVARLLDTARHGAVMSIGIAGSLNLDCRVGQVVLAAHSDLADEGLLTPEGFQSLQTMGFGPFPDQTSSASADPTMLSRLRPLADVLGPVATVSVCSGTSALAAALAARGYVAEAMEGAAVGLVAARVGIPFAELRVISNTTGDRGMQQWDLPGAFDRLGQLSKQVAEVLASR